MVIMGYHVWKTCLYVCILPQSPLFLLLPTHPFRTRTNSQPSSAISGILPVPFSPSRPHLTVPLNTSRTTMWSKTSSTGLEALLLLWFQNVISIVCSQWSSQNNCQKFLAHAGAVFYEVKWNLTQLTTRSTISCWWSVVRLGSWSGQPCLHQLHVLSTPFPGVTRFIYPLDHIFTQHTLPFTLPLINQCDRCLGLLASGLMAERHGFTSYEGITLTI